jgi:GMP reductase
MHIEQDIKLDFSDVLIKAKRSKNSSRKNVNTTREFKFYHSPKTWVGMPVILSNVDVTGCFGMALTAEKNRVITCLHKHYSENELHDFFSVRPGKSTDYIWLSIGMRCGDLEKIINLRNRLPGHSFNICIDVANGQTDQFFEYCAKVRCLFPEAIIMAGNVTDAGCVQELIIHGGVDIAKVGIGGGSVCKTRLVAGVGYPQLSANIECSNVAHGLMSAEKRVGLICSDGGIIDTCDFGKGIGSGADFIMSCGYFAGAEECEGEWEYKTNNEAGIYDPSSRSDTYDLCFGTALSNIKKRLKIYGMSSTTAQEKYGYKNKRTSEGRETYVNYKGPLQSLIDEVRGGLESCCSYVGTDDIKHLSKCCTFVRVNNTHNRSFEK